MKENTFTYTARSAVDPEKMAMFTLHNGSVSVDLGNTLIQQADKAVEELRDETPDKNIVALAKPLATGSIQRLLKPIPLADFDAHMRDGILQTSAWIRAGGLRLAPVMMTWQEVDNPDGAHAFIGELRARKKGIDSEQTLPDPLDYWASWLAIALMTVVLPVFLVRKWRARRASKGAS
jgi:hypothetical protein